jgi:hypothetical protein
MTPEYTLSIGRVVRWPSATILALWWPFMLHIINQVSPYLLISMWCRGLRPKIFEGVVLIQLGELKIRWFLPKFFPSLDIEFHGMLIVMGDLVAILIA